MSDSQQDREQKAKQAAIPTDKKLDQLYSLIDGIDIAMMTTRTANGELVSRPMQVQGRDPGTDLWFVTAVDSGKCKEIAAEPHVNLAFYNDGSREFVSVNGTARVTQNRAKIRELYKPDWKAWFQDEGGAHDGSPDDPRIALIEVDALSATYLKSDTPRPIALFKVAAALITGKPPQIGVMGELNRDQLNQGEGKEKK